MVQVEVLGLKVRFIVNPKAGGSDRTAEVTAAVREVLGSENGMFEINVAAGSDSLSRLSAEAVRKGYDAVFACGGDGTVNHVAAPLVAASTALGIIRLGSGNALAETLGIPEGVRECVSLVKRFSVREIDAGTICGRYFFTTAGLGFEAHLSKRYNTESWSSRMRGLRPYFPLAVMEFFRYRCTPSHIRADGFSAEVAPFLLTAANIERLGGEAFIAPGASPDDGLLDLCFVPRIGLLKSLGLGARLFSKRIEGFPGYTRMRVKEAEITRMGTHAVHVDGEAFDWTGPIEIGVKPKSLRILV